MAAVCQLQSLREFRISYMDVVLGKWMMLLSMAEGLVFSDLWTNIKNPKY